MRSCDVSSDVCVPSFSDYARMEGDGGEFGQQQQQEAGSITIPPQVSGRRQQPNDCNDNNTNNIISLTTHQVRYIIMNKGPSLTRF